MSSATEIAEEMGISKGQVSKFAAKAMKEGWLRKKGRSYEMKKPNPFAPGWSTRPAESDVARNG